MSLKPAQLQTLKVAIDASQVWSAIPNDTDGHIDLARLLNAPAAADRLVWPSNFDVSLLLDNIDQSKYTPNDFVVQSNNDVASLTRIQARALFCQTKLMILQNFVIGRQTINLIPPKVRSSLLDAITAVPAGNNGSAVDPAGGTPAGAAVFNKAPRVATEGEWVLCKAVNATDTTAGVTARVMTYEGNITPSDVAQARAL